MLNATTPGWVGWLEADLGVATLEISLRRDIVSLSIGTRNLAVVDRDALRGWFQRPAQPMSVDDVLFVLVDAQLCVRLDGAGPYPLPTGVVSQLVRSL